MAEFKICPRNSGKTTGEWRLASVDEVEDEKNLKLIKQNGILNSWETARLLDGCVKENYNCVKQHNISKIKRMILIKRVHSGKESATSSPKESAIVESKTPSQSSETRPEESEISTTVQSTTEVSTTVQSAIKESTQHVSATIQSSSLDDAFFEKYYSRVYS